MFDMLTAKLPKKQRVMNRHDLTVTCCELENVCSPCHLSHVVELLCFHARGKVSIAFHQAF